MQEKIPDPAIPEISYGEFHARSSVLYDRITNLIDEHEHEWVVLAALLSILGKLIATSDHPDMMTDIIWKHTRKKNE